MRCLVLPWLQMEKTGGGGGGGGGAGEEPRKDSGEIVVLDEEREGKRGSIGIQFKDRETEI